MKNFCFAFCFLLVLPVLGFGQKQLTIEDASGMNRHLFPSGLRNLQWTGSGERFSYTLNNFVLSSHITNTVTDTLFNLPDINVILQSSGFDTLTRMPAFSWESETTFFFSFRNSVYQVNTSTGSAEKLNSYPENAENIDYYKNGSLLAYTIENNLFIAHAGKQLQVTADDDPGIVNGQSVHRSEFGINKGTFWSPSGEYLAYYRKDETMVTDYPLVNIDSRIATEENIKYPMAGMTSEEVTLVVFRPEDSSYVTLNTGLPADQYLTSITWSPDNQFIYVGILNRGQDHLKLNKYSAKTGEQILALFEEKHDKYVEPLFPLYFPYPDSSHFIWLSQRDGFQHMYLYNARGRLIRQLTEGPWVVTRYLGTDSKNNIAYFLSTRNSPLNEDIFSVEIATGVIQSLSLNTGTHNPVIHPEGRYFIDIYSDTLTSREFAVIDNRGKVLQVIHRSDDPLKGYNKCRIRLFTLHAEDGTELYARMIYPPDFNPKKKYPVMVYLYGGPHAQLVNNTWLGGAGLFLYYMAQQGYLIFTLDNRGSANRGLDFEQAIFRNLGKVEAIDQMTGVNYLRSLPYVDTGRIGLNGWSYGGFMTIYLMLKEPGAFKAGVCGGPVTDWKYYEVMYGERYMDTPEDNPDGYAESSLLTYASELKGELLIIHGTSDPVVVWQHSLALMKKFIEEGIMAEYFVYPGHGHGVGGKDRVHLNRKIEKFFKDHL